MDVFLPNNTNIIYIFAFECIYVHTPFMTSNLFVNTHIWTNVFRIIVFLNFCSCRYPPNICICECRCTHTPTHSKLVKYTEFFRVSWFLQVAEEQIPFKIRTVLSKCWTYSQSLKMCMHTLEEVASFKKKQKPEVLRAPVVPQSTSNELSFVKYCFFHQAFLNSTRLFSCCQQWNGVHYLHTLFLTGSGLS